VRKLFRITWKEAAWGINTTPHGALAYLYCTLMDHDIEPYDYDVMEPCRRCGIEDDRNCMVLRSRLRNLFGDRFAQR
jgi:hypothetical protein